MDKPLIDNFYKDFRPQAFKKDPLWSKELFASILIWRIVSSHEQSTASEKSVKIDVSLSGLEKGANKLKASIRRVAERLEQSEVPLLGPCQKEVLRVFNNIDAYPSPNLGMAVFDVKQVGDSFRTRSVRKRCLSKFEKVLDGLVNNSSSNTFADELVAGMSWPGSNAKILVPYSEWGRLSCQYSSSWNTSSLGSNIYLEEEEAGDYLCACARGLLSNQSIKNYHLRDPLSDRETNEVFDSIVSCPPLRRKEIDLSRPMWGTQWAPSLFIQTVSKRLSEKGLAFVFMPLAFFMDKRAFHSEIWKELIGRDLVRAVIRLGLDKYPGTSLMSELLVLGKGQGSTHILMADFQFVSRSSRFSSTFQKSLGRYVRQCLLEIRDGVTQGPSWSRLEKLFQEKRDEVSTEWDQDQAIDLSDWESLLNPITLFSPSDLLERSIFLPPTFGEFQYKKVLRDCRSDLDQRQQIFKEYRLSDIAIITTGVHIPKDALINFRQGSLADWKNKNNALYVSIKDLKNRKISVEAPIVSSDYLDKGRPRTLIYLEKGDILLSGVGRGIKSYLHQGEGRPIIPSRGLFLIRPRTAFVTSEFLFNYLNSEEVCKLLSDFSVGLIPRLDRQSLENLTLIVPEISYQDHVTNSQATLGGKFFGTVRLGPKYEEKIFFDKIVSELLEFFLANTRDKNASLNPSGTGVVLSMLESLGGRIEAYETTWKSEDRKGGELSSLYDARISKIISAFSLSSWKVSERRNLTITEIFAILTDILCRCSSTFIEQVVSRGLGPGSFASETKELFRAAFEVFSAAQENLTSAPFAHVIASISGMLSTDLVANISIKNRGAFPMRDMRVIVKSDRNSERACGSESIPILGPGETSNLSIKLSEQPDAKDSGVEVFFVETWFHHNGSLSLVEGLARVETAFDRNKSADLKSIQDELGPSPYVDGNPLSPRHTGHLFLGREALIDDIKGNISGLGNTLLLEGNRRSGKTSILRHLEGSERIPGWIAVYSSLEAEDRSGSTLSGQSADSEIYRLFAVEIFKGLRESGCAVILPDGRRIAKPSDPQEQRVSSVVEQVIRDSHPFNDFKDFMEANLSSLRERSTGIVLMVDEFDLMQQNIDSGHITSHIPKNLRYLIQSHDNFTAIFAGSKRLKSMRQDYWSALYGLGSSLTVSHLNEKDARDLIEVPSAGKLSFTPRAVEEILRLSANHPYLIQCICQAAFRYAINQGVRVIEDESIPAIINQTLERYDHFSDLWRMAGRGLPRRSYRRQLMLWELMGTVFVQDDVFRRSLTLEEFEDILEDKVYAIGRDTFVEDLNYLIELDLIKVTVTHDRHFELAIPLFGEWMKMNQDGDDLQIKAVSEAVEE